MYLSSSGLVKNHQKKHLLFQMHRIYRNLKPSLAAANVQEDLNAVKLPPTKNKNPSGGGREGGLFKCILCTSM